jgi:hypothetical protein
MAYNAMSDPGSPVPASEIPQANGRARLGFSNEIDIIA